MRAFAAFAAAKTAAAQRARITPLRTVSDNSSSYPVEQVGNDWTRHMYGGGFGLWPVPDGSRPAVSLVFVQSSEGNTGAENPAELGGGDTDKHLIYEGLSRVAADAVLAGATTAAGPDVFFSVWHPEIVALRQSFGLPRHPAQVIVTGRACIDVESSLVFNVPGVPVYVLGSVSACEALAPAARIRPWVKILQFDGADIRPAVERLKTKHGIQRISAVGGRTTASTLIDSDLVQDVYLTTTARSAGEANTPFYVGSAPPGLDSIVGKRCADPSAPFRFEHLAVTTPGGWGGRTRRGSSTRFAPTGRR